MALANIRTFGFPFVSTVGGLQLLNFNLVLGVEDNNKKAMELIIFPNPTTEKFTIELPTFEKNNYTLELIDVFGRMVLRVEIKNKKMEVYTSKLTG